MFVDEARIFVKAGSGGRGCDSFYRDKYMRYPRPDGGDGGHGGDVVIIANRNVQTLIDCRYQQQYKADSGGHGSSKGKRGRNGKICFIKVPPGTIIKDYESGLRVKELMEDEQSVVVAFGVDYGDVYSVNVDRCRFKNVFYRSVHDGNVNIKCLCIVSDIIESVVDVVIDEH